ncbi:TetR/AcrR family transcriptional regulator C-terminal domain-containing protein [Paracoccus pantotrophus]
MLAAARDEGELGLTDASVAAGQFLSLLCARSTWNCSMGRDPLSARERSACPDFGCALP